MTILTLAEYKSIKNRTKTDDDINLQLVVDTVNSMIISFLGRDPTLATNIEEMISLDYDTDILFPKNWPITAVTNVKEIPIGSPIATVSSYPDLLYDEDYIFEEDRIYRLKSKTWLIGPKRVYIKYTAGYATMPQGLKLAAVELADFYIKEEYLQSRVAGTTTITNLVSDIAKIPAHVRMVLNTYK
jgi:hypothetical protein